MISAVEQYKIFLDGIRRSETNQVLPEAWNRFINTIILKWVNMKQDMVERTQTFTDDLSIITVKTDGVPHPLILRIGAVNDRYIFSIPGITYKNPEGKLPTSYVNENGDPVPPDDEIKGRKIVYHKYPEYFRLLNIYGVTSDKQRIEAKSLDTNREDELLSNTYTKPSGKLCYYSLEDGASYNPGGRIFKLRTDVSELYWIDIAYLRYPEKIFFDESKPLDNPDNVKHIRGGGSVPCEFPESQTLEITDMAIRIFLEMRSDPRWKTFTNEQMINRSIN